MQSHLAALYSLAKIGHIRRRCNMSVFNELNLTWKGADYSVPSDNILRLIAKVEDVITLNELYSYSQKGAAPLAKIATAFGIVLRYAGAKVSDDEVYKTIVTSGADSAIVATRTLLTMMIPPEELIEGNESGKE